MKIPFGKWSNTDISRIPLSYLKWLTKNISKSDLVKYDPSEQMYKEIQEVMRIKQDAVEEYKRELLESSVMNPMDICACGYEDIC